jgi:putative DNA primase/helicase
MMALHQLAKQLGGDVAGRDILMPGPGHSIKDRSLAVRFNDDGFTVHSHANDDWADCKDHVKALLGGNAPASLVGGFYAPDMDKQKQALSIWADSKPWQGSLVETYLAGRGVALPADCEDVRFNPACPMAGQRVPAMVALIRSVSTLEPLAIHRTHLAPNGTKGALDRMMLAPVGDGVVMLSPDYEVTTCLGIGEGIETTLSLRACSEYGLGPVWATLTAGNMAKFKPMAGTMSLFVGVDNDEKGAGERAAHTCAQAWVEHGGIVTLLTPKTFKTDLNDIIQNGELS